MRFTSSLLMSICLVTLVCVGLATAQSVSSRHGVGPYMGFGSDPDQLIMGGQGVFGLAGSPVHFSPGLDFGFGDDLNVVTVNFDVTYDFVPSSSRVAFYVGAGPTVAFYSSDRFDNDSEMGLSLVTGAKFPTGAGNSFNLGIRAGMGDIPDIKMTAAYIFNLR